MSLKWKSFPDESFEFKSSICLSCACCSRVGFRLLLSLAHWSALLMRIFRLISCRKRRLEIKRGVFFRSRPRGCGDGTKVEKGQDWLNFEEGLKSSRWWKGEKKRPTWIQRCGLARYDSSWYETDIERETAEIQRFGMVRSEAGGGGDTR